MNKLFVAYLVCIAITTVVVGYDFDDTIYNQILADDLEDMELDDLESSVVNPRSRRDDEASKKDEKCRRRRFKSCCDEEFLNDLRDQERATKKECYREITGREHSHGSFDPFRCENAEKHRKEITCVGQCVGQKAGIIDSDGNIKEDAARERIKEKLSKKEWLSVLLDDLITKCFGEAREAASKRDTNSTDTCNPSAIKFSHCLWKEVQLHCPADQIKDERKCNKIREEISKNITGIYDE